MATDWFVQRIVSPRPDGQRRWDLAYQLLAQWSGEHPPEPTTPSAPVPEVPDGSRALCPRLDPPPGSDPDH